MFKETFNVSNLFQENLLLSPVKKKKRTQTASGAKLLLGWSINTNSGTFATLRGASLSPLNPARSFSIHCWHCWKLLLLPAFFWCKAAKGVGVVSPRGGGENVHLQGKENLETAWERSTVRAPQRLFAPYAHRSLRWETCCPFCSAMRAPLLRITALRFAQVPFNVKYTSFLSHLPTQRSTLLLQRRC